MEERSSEARAEYVEHRNRAENVKRNAKEGTWVRIGEQFGCGHCLEQKN